eukprot:gb/GEZN01012161.1/.p1 GENE.gb/GEZN01012161.1/~~gb/GEZN01012161.1/.p1  ORF type:complete len:345 (-),score=39.46 gb/GEZN01012161.1/:69-1073(-)
MSGPAILGGIELGGTTTVVTIAQSDPTNVTYTEEFPTTSPQETLEKAVKILGKHKISYLGIGAFGPIDLDQKSPTYGYVTTTPKPRWGNANVLSYAKRLGVPYAIETDVTAAAIGELTHGKHGKIMSCCYVTVGTGIGTGLVTHNQAVYGVTHPEGGHWMPRMYPGDTYKGTCPYHGHCLEGLANSKAVADRLGITVAELKDVPDTHPIWDLVAYYLAELCVVLACLVSPDVIVLGGGVLKRVILFPKIRKQFVTVLNGYLQQPKFLGNVDDYIVPSRFNKPGLLINGQAVSAGQIGTLELARRAGKLPLNEGGPPPLIANHTTSSITTVTSKL